MDYLRYEITKISGRKCFCHLQGGNFEFKIAVRTNTKKYLKKDNVIKGKFLNKLRSNIASIKSQFVLVENERKKKGGEEGRKKERKGGVWRKGELEMSVWLSFNYYYLYVCFFPFSLYNIYIYIYIKVVAKILSLTKKEEYS